MVYQRDPNRLLLECAIGQVQAWRPADPTDTAVCMSFYAGFLHKGETQSYTSTNHSLTVADARNLAEALLKAADHADALAQAEAA